jgi:hypothetical protein
LVKSLLFSLLGGKKKDYIIFDSFQQNSGNFHEIHNFYLLYQLTDIHSDVLEKKLKMFKKMTNNAQRLTTKDSIVTQVSKNQT